MQNRSQMLIRSLAALPALAAPVARAAAEQVAPQLAPAPMPGGQQIASLGLSMLIVVGAIVALGWLYSRFRWNGAGGADVINVVASRALGPKERLLLVEVADRQLLVGMTASQVQTLHVFEEPVETAKAAGLAGGFRERLRSVLTEADE